MWDVSSSKYFHIKVLFQEVEYHIFKAAGVTGTEEHISFTEDVWELLERATWQCHAWRTQLERTNQTDDIPSPACSRMTNVNTAIFVMYYLMLSLKFKFINVTEERAIVCSSSKTCLC